MQWRERAQSDVQRHPRDVRAGSAAAVEDFRREVQSSRRRCDRSAALGIYRLITASIVGSILPSDVWRQGHVPDMVGFLEDITSPAKRIVRSPCSPRSITSARSVSEK